MMAQSSSGVKRYDLESVDLLRERMGVGYEQARDALEAAEGDVVEALVWLERHDEGTCEELTAYVEELVEQTNEVMAGQQVTGIDVKLLDRAIWRLPTALAGVGAAIIVILGEMMSKCSVELSYAPADGQEMPQASVRDDHSTD